jgi:organic radical activating enzyme
MYCKHPHTGLTINPQGNIVVCCVSTQNILDHISNVESLSDLYRNNPVLNDLRNEKSETIERICQKCIGRENNNDISRRVRFNKRPLTCGNNITYLEVTTSNICNQTCTTCNSFFSSKWKEYDEEVADVFGFRTKPFSLYKMTENDIDKIINELETLETLCIKGGEPFADNNNLKILKALAECNPNCTVTITSNFANISDAFLDVLSKFKTVKIAASMDGTGLLYQWIRSTKFDKTVANMEKFYERTGHKVGVAITVSLYNCFNMFDIVQYFHDKPYITTINFTSFIIGPVYARADLLPYNIRKQIVKKFFSDLESITPQCRIDSLEIIKNFGKEELITSSGISDIDNAKQWISYMNMIRDLDIYDIVPQLKDHLNE